VTLSQKTVARGIVRITC